MATQLKQTLPQLHIRWMIRRDVPFVLDIETRCFRDAVWTEEDFLKVLRQRNVIGLVAEIPGRDEIAGFMLYELHPKYMWVQNFAVHPSCHRRGVGRQMVQKLVGKTSMHRRTSIRADVRETNLAAQLFFRS